MEEGSGQKRLIVLMGASVGAAWNIASLPKRTGHYDDIFEFVHGGSSFDKSEKLSNVLSRTDGKPHMVILKECAAYFPGDMDRYKGLMKRWIGECRSAEVIPIPTTVVTVTRLHAYKIFFGFPLLRKKNPLSFGWPFQQKRFKSICAYNDWLRIYAGQEKLTLLDMEAALRRSEKDRYLRADLARMDGLHLKPAAYALLDKIVIVALNES